jgi:hypothetical protein
MMHQICAEPSLDDLLKDTAMGLLMRSDGVSEGDIRGLLRRKAASRPRLRSLAARLRRWLRPASVIGLLAAVFIGLPAAREALWPPAAAIRSDLVAAAVEVARPISPRPTDAELHAIQRHFAAFDATVDASAWPQIAVTLRHLDRAACGEVLGASRRIEGLVVVELERYRSAADCADDNAMTWSITP